ncbi:MAG: hypothetical protein WAK48_12945 [Candidatus Acidiferrum sp.]
MMATLEPKATGRAADFNLRIAPMTVELAPQVVLSTIGYSNQVPGPLLRVREAQPVAPPGNYGPRKGIREFIVGTGGETLDTVVASTSSTADAGAKFNAANLEASTGDYWGVMALTLDSNGYKWDFEPALELPGAPAGTYNDKGVGTCHGPVNR